MLGPTLTRLLLRFLDNLFWISMNSNVQRIQMERFHIATKHKHEPRWNKDWKYCHEILINNLEWALSWLSEDLRNSLHSQHNQNHLNKQFMFLGFFWDLNQWPLDGRFKLSPSKFNKTAKTPFLLSLHWQWNLTPMFRSQTIRHHQNRHHKDNTIDCKVSCHSLIHSECEFYRLNEFNDIICFSTKPGHTQRFVILEPTLERLAKIGGDHTT